MVDALIRMLPRGFLAFFLAGLVGLLVDLSILVVLVHIFDWGVYAGRVASVIPAMTVTWILNRRFAFAEGASRHKGREYSRYLIAHVMGATVNFLVYGLCLNLSTTMHMYPALAMLCGCASGLIFNYSTSRWWVFLGDAPDNA